MIQYGTQKQNKIEKNLISFSLINIMSKSSKSDLEEVDIEKNLKKLEESGEDTGSIVLSEGDDDDQTGPTFVDTDDDANEVEEGEIVEDEKKEEQDLGEEPDETSVSTSEKEAEKQRIEARGKADANRILAASLTSNILRDKGIEATLKLAESPNSKVVIVGSGKDGLPLILGNN